MSLSALLCVTLSLVLAPTVRAGDPAADLVQAAKREWALLEGKSLESDVYRDKKRLCTDLTAVFGEDGPKADEARKAGRLLAAWIEKAPPEGLAWRVNELRGRLFLGTDARLASEAFVAALTAYPRERYPQPPKHSYFHHLAIDATLARWDAEGLDSAEGALIALARDDPRFQYCLPDRLEGRYVAAEEIPRLRALYTQLADALQPRLPELARELRERPLPDLRRLNGDPRMRFLVLGADRKTDGPRHLVVVMPGGSGQIDDFKDWVATLATPLLDRFVFAQLAAPVWSPAQAKEWVWVTEPVQKQYKAEFPVERFAREVAGALRADESLRLDKAVLFAWSSGGPAAYATLIDEDPTFAGAYVLASVFRPKGLAPAHARGRRVWLEQGRADKVTPLRFAHEAQRWLEASGAAVQLVEFEGGHGFAMPDAAASLAAALAWLCQ